MPLEFLVGVDSHNHSASHKETTMHSRTQAILDELERAEWFRAVGQKDTDAEITLSSWEEAITSCSSVEWEDVLIEAANLIRDTIVRHSKERLNQWNTIAAEVKEVTIPLVARKTERLVREHGLPQAFVGTV